MTRIFVEKISLIFPYDWSFFSLNLMIIMELLCLPVCHHEWVFQSVRQKTHVLYCSSWEEETVRKLLQSVVQSNLSWNSVLQWRPVPSKSKSSLNTYNTVLLRSQLRGRLIESQLIVSLFVFCCYQIFRRIKFSVMKENWHFIVKTIPEKREKSVRRVSCCNNVTCMWTLVA